MMNMTQEQIIDVEAQEVVEEIFPVDLPVEMSSEPPVKTKEQRKLEMERFNEIKKIVKQNRKYYKSNLFQIQKLDSTK